MSLPITPLTVTATMQLAQTAGEAIVETLDRGASFAQHLLASTGPTATDEAPTEDLSEQLGELQRQLVQRLQAAGVDLGFRVDVVSKGDSLTLSNVHPDQEQIAAAVGNDKELHAMFEKLQELLAQQNPRAASQGSLRLQFQDDELAFDFGG